MISCDKAALICDKAQYNEASFFDKAKLKLHMLICKACTSHAKKNATLTSLCKEAKLKSLTENEKNVMKKQIENQL
jgi:hypothetical protein